MDLAANLLLPSESGGGSIRSEVPWRRTTNARKQQIVMVGIGGSHRHRIIQSADLAACSALRNLQPPAKNPAAPKNCQDPSEKSKVIAVDTAPLPRRRTPTKLASFPPSTCYPEDREIEQKRPLTGAAFSFAPMPIHPIPTPAPGTQLPAPSSRLQATGSLFIYIDRSHCGIKYMRATHPEPPRINFIPQWIPASISESNSYATPQNRPSCRIKYMHANAPQGGGGRGYPTISPSSSASRSRPSAEICPVPGPDPGPLRQQAPGTEQHQAKLQAVEAIGSFSPQRFPRESPAGTARAGIAG